MSESSDEGHIYWRGQGKYRPQPNRFPSIAKFPLPVNQVTRIHFDTVSKDFHAINRRSLSFCLKYPIQFPPGSIENKIGLVVFIRCNESFVLKYASHTFIL